LHDNITQLLCAILLRSQTLANGLSAGAAKRQAIALRKLLGHAATEVERISQNLRPGILDILGLVAVLHDASTEFAQRTGVAVKVACVHLTQRLPADTELTLYRILQEALRNVEQHAHARRVTVRLKQQGNFILLAIDDDGIGFEPNQLSAKGEGGLGLLSMRERANYAGGVLTIKSTRRTGTKIEVSIPLSR